MKDEKMKKILEDLGKSLTNMLKKSHGETLIAATE